MTNNYNKNLNQEKIKYINVQLLATIGFIVSLFISFTLSVDKKLMLQNKKRLFSDKDAQNLALFQTILVFLISISFLYINYNQYKIAKEINEDDENDLFLQIETSIFAIISAIIGLYIVFKNYRSRRLTIAETEIT